MLYLIGLFNKKLEGVMEKIPEINNRGPMPKFRRGKYQHVEASVSLPRLEKMLENLQTSRSRELSEIASDLREMISEDKVRILAGIHAGGTGGRDGVVDKRKHITIRAGRTNYHIRLNTKGHVFQITF